MKSTYKLVWSDEALKNLNHIISYLESKWTKREIKKFVLLLDKQISLIQSNPLIFPEHNQSMGLRRSVLSKQTTIYYRIEKHEILIVSLFDNRQNPSRLGKK